GIDYEKYSTPIPAYFEIDEFPVFYDNAHINEAKLDQMIKDTWYIDYVTLLPTQLSGVYSDDSVENISKIPNMCEETIKKALDIDFDVRTFKFYNFVQSLMYHNKAIRVDDDNKKMKIIDLGKQDVSEKFVKQYIRSQYNNKYALDLLNKS